MAQNGPLLRQNDVIGKYRVERCLGIGGMGEVYLVRHIYLNSLRALKLLRMDVATQDPVFCERFLREARIASRVQHKNLVAVMDVENDTESGFFYIVMEYVNGNSLRDILKNGPLPEDQAIHIVSEVAEALGAAAEFHLVHRDIKPANVMISREGEVKLADLGIAKASDDDVSVTLTMDNTLIGTPAYSSPEQCRNSHTVDTRADIYSLGATLYEMVTGIPPFSGANSFDTIAHVLHDEPTDPALLNPKLSQGLTALIRWMMARKPEDRPQNIAELQEELKKFQTDHIMISPEIKSLIQETVERKVQERTSTVIETYRKKRKIELTGGSFAAAVLLILVCIILFVRNANHSREVRNYQSRITALEKEKLALENQAEMLRENLRRQERINFQRRGSAATLETLKQLKDEISELKNQNRNLRERLQELQNSASQAATPVSSLPTPLKQSPRGDTDSPSPESKAAVKEKQPEPPAAQNTSADPRPSTLEQQRELRSLFMKPEIRKAAFELDAPQMKELFEKNGLSLREITPSRESAAYIMQPIRYSMIIPSHLRKKDFTPYLQYLHQNGLTLCNLHFSTLLLFSGLPSHMSDQNQKQLMENIMDGLEYLIQINSHRIPPIQLPPSFPHLLPYAFRFPAQEKFLRLLLEKGGFDINEKNNQGYTALDIVYFCLPYRTRNDPFPKILRFLKRKGAKNNKISELDIRLALALRDKSVEDFHSAISAGADIRKNYPLVQNPLHFAVLLNPADESNTFVKELLEAGADPNVPGKTISTLAISLLRKNDTLAKLLIQHGAKTNDEYALRYACQNGHAEIARILLKSGTDPDTKTFSPGETPLCSSIRNKNAEISELLIQYGADVNRKTYNGKTLLELAQADPKLKRTAAMIRRKLAAAEQKRN